MEKQLHWKTKFELAQRLANAVYKARDAIAEVRYPAIFENETAQALKEENIQADSESINTLRAVYNRRWRRVQQAFLELDSLALEGEAIWGSVIHDVLEPFQQCGRTLLFHLNEYLDRKGSSDKVISGEARLRERAVIYAYGHEKGNSFSDEIKQSVTRIENFLKPYLKM